MFSEANSRAVSSKGSVLLPFCGYGRESLGYLGQQMDAAVHLAHELVEVHLELEVRLQRVEGHLQNKRLPAPGTPVHEQSFGLQPCEAFEPVLIRVVSSRKGTAQFPRESFMSNAFIFERAVEKKVFKISKGKALRRTFGNHRQVGCRLCRFLAVHLLPKGLVIFDGVLQEAQVVHQFVLGGVVRHFVRLEHLLVDQRHVS